MRGDLGWGTGRLLLAFSGRMPGMLLNILKCTGQLLTKKRIIQPKMSVATKVRKPCYRYVAGGL